jgi:hypothetical protein
VIQPRPAWPVSPLYLRRHDASVIPQHFAEDGLWETCPRYRTSSMPIGATVGRSRMTFKPIGALLHRSAAYGLARRHGR